MSETLIAGALTDAEISFLAAWSLRPGDASRKAYPNTLEAEDAMIADMKARGLIRTRMLELPNGKVREMPAELTVLGSDVYALVSKPPAPPEPNPDEPARVTLDDVMKMRAAAQAAKNQD